MYDNDGQLRAEVDYRRERLMRDYEPTRRRHQQRRWRVATTMRRARAARA